MFLLIGRASKMIIYIGLSSLCVKTTFQLSRKSRGNFAIDWSAVFEMNYSSNMREKTGCLISFYSIVQSDLEARLGKSTWRRFVSAVNAVASTRSSLKSKHAIF